MPFVTAGDPDLATTGRLLPVMEQAGASICELGFAFSDPVADGPVIQASMTHALGRGVRPVDVLEMVAQERSGLGMGLVAMVSYSIAYRLGVGSFVRDARAAGIDGFIFPDMTLEESAAARDAAAQEGLIVSFLIAPTTPIERARQIARASSGFVYLLSRAGITGERSRLPDDLPGRIDALRAVTDLPIAVGFGISDQSQVRRVLGVADAAIVGSAIMRRVADHRGEGADRVVEAVGRFVGELAKGVGNRPPRSF